MNATSTITTRGLKATERVPLIRDTAFSLFGLEAELGNMASGLASADIHVVRRPAASMIDVRTSHSTVRRTSSLARFAHGSNLLVYLIREGGSRFENARGEQFKTSVGSVVVGSQDAAYRAVAAPAAEWSFRALSVASHLLPLSGSRIRSKGFQLLSPTAPLGNVLSSYASELCSGLADLDVPSADASLRALDHLLGAALGQEVDVVDDLAGAVATHRRRCALECIRRDAGSAGLTPASIAAAMGISPRQLHRAFESTSMTVTAEIRRIRIERASEMLAAQPLKTITEIALSCGFDSLATFYRQFKATLGMTASEWRAGAGR